MKQATISGDIQDVGGFYMDLVKAGFEIYGMTQHAGMTVVKLHDLEDKDPLQIAELWIGRPAVRPSVKEIMERRDLIARYEAGREERLRALQEQRSSIEDDYIPDFGTEQILPLSDGEVKKESLIGRLKNSLKKLW